MDLKPYRLREIRSIQLLNGQKINFNIFPSYYNLTFHYELIIIYIVIGKR